MKTKLFSTVMMALVAFGIFSVIFFVSSQNKSLLVQFPYLALNGENTLKKYDDYTEYKYIWNFNGPRKNVKSALMKFKFENRMDGSPGIVCQYGDRSLFFAFSRTLDVATSTSANQYILGEIDKNHKVNILSDAIMLDGSDSYNFGSQEVNYAVTCDENSVSFSINDSPATNFPFDKLDKLDSVKVISLYEVDTFENQWLYNVELFEIKKK